MGFTVQDVGTYLNVKTFTILQSFWLRTALILITFDSERVTESENKEDFRKRIFYNPGFHNNVR